MIYQNMRGAMALCSVATVLLAVPAQSSACAFLDCLFGGRAQTTYRPAYAFYAPASSSACAPCGVQTCRYVPQTCYRTVYQGVPVTTYRAVAGCDPCTGCPVTAYRPVTSWTYRARLIPYTTYRAVYSDPCNPCASYESCSPCGSFGGTVGTTVTESVGCCSGTTTTPSGSMVPQADPATSAPALESTPPARTFDDPGSSGEPIKQLEPTPNANLNSTPTQLQLSDPRGRTTLRPVRQASYYRLIASPPKTAPVHNAGLKTVVNDGGWRAASE